MIEVLHYLNSNSGILMLLFSAVVAISTVFYVRLTRSLVEETRKMRQAQTDPKIEVILKPREEWINMVYVCVRNIGLGPAYDISFQIDKEGNAAGAEALIHDFTEAKFFATGLRYLSPNEEVFSNYTLMTKQLEEKIGAVLLFAVRYRNAVGRSFIDSYRIDFSEWSGRRQGGIPFLYTISQSLENIQKDLHSLTLGFNRLSVNMYGKNDREEETAHFESMREERNKKKSPKAL
jgi:hypothetical protein